MQTKDFTQNSNLYATLIGQEPAIYGSFPGFRDYVDHGPILHGDHVRPLEWSYGVFTIHYTMGSAVAQGGNYGSGLPCVDKFNISGPLQGIGVFSVSYLPAMLINAENTALSRLNEKVRGGLDLSVAIGESSETRRMVKAIGSWDRWFKGFGPKRWAKEWLEYTYGWKPLLSDIYNATQDLKRKNDSMLHFSARASEQREASGTRSLGRPDIVGDGTGFIIQEGPVLTSKTGGIAKASCMYGITLKPPSKLSNAARWTSLNPLSIAWELMPYSFVIDWFVDVGSYLRDIETSLIYGPEFVSGFKSSLKIMNVSESIDYNHRGTNSFFDGVMVVNASNKVDYKVFNRSILTTYPLPHLPQVKTDLSWKRLMSAAALLTQQLK